MHAYTAPSNISEDYALRTKYKKKRFGKSNLLFDQKKKTNKKQFLTIPFV